MTHQETSHRDSTQYPLSLANNHPEIPLFSRKKVEIYVCFCRSLPIS